MKKATNKSYSKTTTIENNNHEVSRIVKTYELPLKVSKTGLTYFVEHGKRFFLLHQICYIPRPELVRGQPHERLIAPIIKSYKPSRKKGALPSLESQIFHDWKRKVGLFIFVPEDRVRLYIKTRNQIILSYAKTHKKGKNSKGFKYKGWDAKTAAMIEAEFNIEVYIDPSVQQHRALNPQTKEDALWYAKFKKLPEDAQTLYRKFRKNVNALKRHVFCDVDLKKKFEDDLKNLIFNGTTAYEIAKEMQY